MIIERVQQDILLSAGEHGWTPALEHLALGLGAADLLNVELSEEGIIDWTKRKIAEIRHNALIHANKKAAALNDFSDDILRDIGQAEKEGPYSTIKLPVGRIAHFCQGIVGALTILNDIDNSRKTGTHDLRGQLRDRREESRDHAAGSRAIREAMRKKKHPRETDAFIKKIKGMSKPELASFVKQQVAQGQKALAEIQRQLKSNKNLTPTEISRMNKVLRKLHVM